MNSTTERPSVADLTNSAVSRDVVCYASGYRNGYTEGYMDAKRGMQKKELAVGEISVTPEQIAAGHVCSGCGRGTNPKAESPTDTGKGWFIDSNTWCAFCKRDRLERSEQ